MRIAHIAFGVLFAVAALLQLNDPDVARWFAMYASAAAACWVAPSWPRRWVPPVVIGLVAAIWAVLLASVVLPTFDCANLLRAKDPAFPQIEETRELLGLLLVAAWMSVRALDLARKR